jgi:hypothetical protein
VVSFFSFVVDSLTISSNTSPVCFGVTSTASYLLSVF